MPGRVERAPVVVVLDERLELAFEVAGSSPVGPAINSRNARVYGIVTF
jgi:hypothetical protein